MLKEVKSNWVDELHSVLWVVHITPHSVMKETPFKLTYGTEAIILIKVGETSI